MYVFSYLELHTTLIGWILYDLLFAALAGTGIIAVPFLWILFKNWRKSATDGDALDRSTHNDAKALLIELALAFIIFIVAVFPWIPIQPTTVSFTPQPSFANSIPTTVNANTDPSTYKNELGALASSNTPRIPIWWRLVAGISSGVTNAVIQNLPTPGDLRDARVQLSSSNINNPNLAHEYRSFVSTCFVPAKNRFERRVVDGRIDSSAVDATDIDWPGGKFLKQTQGLYAGCPGGSLAAVDACGSTISIGDIGAKRGLTNNTCAGWWDALESDIYDADSANDSLWGNLKTSVNLLATFSTDKVREARVKNLLNNLGAQSVANEPTFGNQNVVGSAFNFLEDVAGTYAIGKETLVRSGLINIMKQAMPILIAVILLMLYFMMPAAIVFTAYSIEAIVALSFIMFSLIFTHALFTVAAWLDYYLITSIFKDVGLFAWLSGESHTFGTLQKRWLLNIIVGALYVGMPMIWLYVMGIAGAGAARSSGLLVGRGMGAGQTGAMGGGQGNVIAGARSARTGAGNLANYEAKYRK